MIAPRVIAWLLALGSVLVVDTPDANAQVAIPPLPPDVAEVVEVISPIVHPLCGDALLVSGIAIGLIPPALREIIQPFTGTPFVVCGLVPPAGARRAECEVDAVAGGLLDQVAFAVLGGASPFAPPEVARLVDSLLLVQDRLPAPVADLDLVTTTAALVLCGPIVPDEPGPPAAPPATVAAPASAPPSGPPGDSALPTFDAPAGGSLPLPIPIVGGVVSTPASRQPTVTARPVATTAPLRVVTYPVFLAPLAVVALIIVLARGFLATPHEPQG
jgi:hypothetical protein